MVGFHCGSPGRTGSPVSPDMIFTHKVEPLRVLWNKHIFVLRMGALIFVEPSPHIGHLLFLLGQFVRLDSGELDYLGWFLATWCDVFGILNR